MNDAAFLGQNARGFLVLLAIAIVLHEGEAQRQVTTIDEERLKSIFNLKPVDNRRGFGDVVTPEPSTRDQLPTIFNSTNGRNGCRCVLYHMCHPNDPTIGSGNQRPRLPALPRIPIQNDTFDGFGVIDLRADFQSAACDHYLEVCCEDERTSNTSLTPTPQDERPNRLRGCGVRNFGGIDFNLTGAHDNEAGFGEFPWTVALLNADNSSYFCAGSLIHPAVVLTARHCLTNRSPGSFKVRAGEWDTQTTKERLPFQERDVLKVITHPSYNDRNAAFDFALLILSRQFNLMDHINVVCLPEALQTTQQGTECISTGWGKDKFGASGRYSTIMKRIPLPIVDFNACQRQLRSTRLGNRFALDRSVLCAGGQRGIDTCEGDGGAPLVCPIGAASDNRFHQSGIVSWGLGCNEDIPGAYANVALARDWIDDEMLANGFTTSSYIPV